MANLADKFRKMNAGKGLNYGSKPAPKKTTGDSLGSVVGGKPDTKAKGNRPAAPKSSSGKLSGGGGMSGGGKL